MEIVIIVLLSLFLNTNGILFILPAIDTIVLIKMITFLKKFTKMYHEKKYEKKSAKDIC
jgi:hypothetical protein